MNILRSGLLSQCILAGVALGLYLWVECGSIVGSMNVYLCRIKPVFKAAVTIYTLTMLLIYLLQLLVLLDPIFCQLYGWKLVSMVLICISWIIYEKFNKWNRKRMIIHMKNKSDSYLTSDMQINSRWIKDSNIKSKTLKLPEKNRSVYLQIWRVGKDFLNMGPKKAHYQLSVLDLTTLK